MERQKLVVEQKAEALVTEIARLRRKVRYHCKASRDAERSGDSMLLSIGEGVAAFQPRVKAAAYDIARREAKEVQSALRALILKRKLSEDDCAYAFDLADTVVAMLTNMIKNLERRF